MSLSPQQLAERLTGMTATDVSAISGLNPWRRPIDVWLDKTGRAAPFAGNELTKWGNILEGPVRDDYAERHGVRVEVPGTLAHPTITWAKATPDGICYVPMQSMPTNGLEIKVHNFFGAADQYGNPGTDEVPPYELIQCMWSIFVTGLDRWDLVPFVNGRTNDYVINRDDDLIGYLREDAERFMINHVRKDVPPDPDGTASYDSYLTKAYPHRKLDLVSLDDKPTAMMQVRSLRVMLDSFAQLETEIEIAKQNLKAVIGEHAGLEWSEPDGKKQKITYKLSKEGSKVDWEAAWRSLTIEAQLALSDPCPDVDALVAALANIADTERSITSYIELVPGSRRFLTPRTWNKKEI